MKQSHSPATRLSCATALLCLALLASSCHTNDRGRYSNSAAHSQASLSPGKKLLQSIFGDRERNRRARQAAVKPTSPPRPVIPATKVNHSILADTNSSNASVMIDISRQKVFLLRDGYDVALEAAISSGRPGKPTPRGTFRITEKVRSGKYSTIYDVEMPNWMRLSGSEYGVHAGYLPGFPASAGCVRLPRDAAAIIYDHVGYGTRVTITDSWAGSGIGSTTRPVYRTAATERSVPAPPPAPRSRPIRAERVIIDLGNGSYRY